MNSKLDYNVDLDLSLRVLGNELAWVNFQDIETPLTPSVLINKLGNFVETGLGSAKSYKKNHKNHFQFLDSQLAYPTSMGLALRLNAVGSGVVYLKLGGNLDVPAFLKNPKNGHANFEFVPRYTFFFFEMSSSRFSLY